MTKDNDMITHALVADHTASIYMSLWNEQGEQIQPGDIIRLTNGYSTLFRNAMVLHSARVGGPNPGALEKIGECVVVGGWFVLMLMLMMCVQVYYVVY